MDGFYAEILKTPILWKDGYIIPSKEPGLGVNLNENILRKYTYDDKDLHLHVSNQII